MGEDGAALSRAKLRTRAAAAVITGALSKRCCGSRGQGSPWRDLPLFFGNWNSGLQALPRLGEGWRFHPTVGEGLFRSRRTWNTPWSMPPSSKSIATVQAQKGDAEPGDRPLQGRHDDQNTRADRRARQSGPLRPAARPPFRYGRRRFTGIDEITFGGLIADKAFDSNAIIANLNERGAKIVIYSERRALPLRLDTELYCGGA